MKITRKPKRYRAILEEEWTIDIFVEDADSIEASSILDVESDEYHNFVDNMISMFTLAGFVLYDDPDYTHRSNKGSQSWYYTFLKIKDTIELQIVVNIRISDHPDKDRVNQTAAQKRNSYTHRIAHEIAENYGTENFGVPYAIDILIDDEHCKTYFEAELKLRNRLKYILKHYQEMIDVEDQE